MENIKASLQEEARSSVGDRPSSTLRNRVDFTSIAEVDMLEQQKLLETFVGHCLNHWGNAPVAWQQIKGKLIDNLSDSIDNLLEEFMVQFKKETVFIYGSSKTY